MAFGKARTTRLKDGFSDRKSKQTTLILLEVLIYMVCVFAAAAGAMPRIYEANKLVGSTAFTVNSSYGEVVHISPTASSLN